MRKWLRENGKEAFLRPYRMIMPRKWQHNPRDDVPNIADIPRKMYNAFRKSNDNRVMFKRGIDEERLSTDYFVFDFYNRTGKIPEYLQFRTAFPLSGSNSVRYKYFSDTVNRLHKRELAGANVLDGYGDYLLNSYKDNTLPGYNKKLADFAVFRANNNREAPRLPEPADTIVKNIGRVGTIFGGDGIADGANDLLGGGIPGRMAGRFASRMLQNHVTKKQIEENRKTGLRRPVIQVQKEINDLKMDQNENMYHGLDDQSTFKIIADKIVDSIIPPKQDVQKTEFKRPVAMPIGNGGGWSLFHNGYKRRFTNRRFRYNNKRGRHFGRYYQTYSKKNRYGRRKYRKYFFRF